MLTGLTSLCPLGEHWTGALLRFGGPQRTISVMLCLLISVIQAYSQKQDQLDLYLLLGQSNMAGRGAPDGFQLHTDSILVLDAQQRWQPAVEPLHFDKPVAGTGLAATFAMAILPASNQRLGLIPCAVGGTSIRSWRPGAVDPATRKKPYDDAIARAKTALESGQLKAILWHQGESDSSTDRVSVYRQEFEELMENLHRDLGLELGSVPVIVGELGVFPTEKNAQSGKAKMNEVLQSLPLQYPYVRCVSAEGMHHIGDHTHFDTPSLRALGKRYAEAFLAIKP